MWRSFFLAAGVYCCLLGVQSLAVEKAVLNNKEPAPARFMNLNMPGSNLTRNKEFTTPDWAPWSLMSFGAVTLLYSFTIPKRAAGG
jgi:hypothetical protein